MTAGRICRVDGKRGLWICYDEAADKRGGNIWCLPARHHGGAWQPTWEGGWRAFRKERILDPPKRYKGRRVNPNI